MTSALIGLALILLIAVSAVALGTLTRLIAGRIAAPRELDGAPLTPLERVALGHEIIARDLQPDDLHPVARTAAQDLPSHRVAVPADPVRPRQDLALRHPEIASHALR